MNRLETTIEDVHVGMVIHDLPDGWNRTAKVLVGEIDRLREELAECRAAREAVTPPVDREALGRIARAAFCRRSDSIHRRLPGWSSPSYIELDGDAREDWNCIGEAVAAAVISPAPAAIAMWTEGYGADGDVGIHVTLLADGSDEARATYESGPGGMRTYRVASWTWHPAAAPGESRP